MKRTRFPKNSLDIIVIGAMGGFLAVIAAHLALGQSASSQTGLVTVLDRVSELVIALIISIVATSVGSAVCKALGISFANTAERLSFSLFMGTGVLGLAVLFLGLIGLLKPLAISVMLMLALGLSGRNLPELYRLMKAGLRGATINREAIGE